jgi:hypothetical protein
MLPDDLKECIRQLFIIMWATGTTYCLEESQTILLYKDKGDITDITKYRPVGLLNTVYKLWTRHITTAMADYAGPSAFTTRRRAIYRGRNRVNDTPLDEGVHVQICWRAASKTRRTTAPRHASVRRMRQDVPHVLHQPLHYHAPLKMKQNSGDARLAATPTTQPDAPLVAPSGRTPGKRKKTSPWTVWQQQSRSGTRSTKTSPTRQSADALDKDPPTVSDKVWADAGESGSAHGKPVRSKLIASTNPRALG